MKALIFSLSVLLTACGGGADYAPVVQSCSPDSTDSCDASPLPYSWLSESDILVYSDSNDVESASRLSGQRGLVSRKNIVCVGSESLAVRCVK